MLKDTKLCADAVLQKPKASRVHKESSWSTDRYGDLIIRMHDARNAFKKQIVRTAGQLKQRARLLGRLPQLVALLRNILPYLAEQLAFIFSRFLDTNMVP